MKINPAAVFILCCLCVVANFTQAQYGYQLNFNATGLKNKKIFLGYFAGSPAFRTKVDSALLNTDTAKATISNKKKIIGSIYYLMLSGNDERKLIIIDNGTKLTINLTEAGIKKIAFTNSPVNKALEYYTDISNIPDRLKAIDSLQRKYKTSVLYNYLECEKRKFLAKTNNRITNENKRAVYFKNFDWQEKRLKLLPNLFPTLYGYMQTMPNTPENFTESAGILLKSIDSKLPIYPIVLNWLFDNLEFQRFEGYEQTYVKLSKQYLTKDVQMSVTDYQSVFGKTMLFEKLPNGSKAPNLILADSTKSSFKLYDLLPTKKYTLLAFFDPYCHQCQIKMPEMAAMLKKSMVDTLVNKISILSGASEIGWKEFLDTHKLTDWFNLKPTDGGAAIRKDFLVVSTPLFFLLDSTGRIISKSSIIEEIKRGIEK